MSPSQTYDSIDDEGAEDVFEDAIFSLFDHRPVAFSGRNGEYLYEPSELPFQPDQEYTVEQSKSSDDRLSVRLPAAPASLHSTLQLTHIWLSSILMADLIHHGSLDRSVHTSQPNLRSPRQFIRPEQETDLFDRQEGPSSRREGPLAGVPSAGLPSAGIDVRGKRVIELGAGAGLPSIMASRRGASETIATDYDSPEVLVVTQHNLDTHGRGTRSVRGLIWGSSTHELGTFDLVLLADLLWASTAHDALVETTRSLLRRTKKARAQGENADTESGPSIGHVIAGHHQGRGSVERFRALWQDCGGWCSRPIELKWKQQGGWEYHETSTSHSAIETESERGVIAWFTIGI